MSRAGKPRDQRRAVAAMLAALALGTAGELCLGADPGPANVPVPSGRSPAAQKAVPAARVAPVDINSAGRAELKTLPGIGDAEATRIIAGRPYLSKADLATREVIPTGMFLSLKNRIIAIQKQQPKAGD